MNNPTSDTIPYIDCTGKPIDVIFDAKNETIWITQEGMSEIFHVSVQTISYHLKNIFLSSELSENQATQIKFEKFDNQAIRKPAYCCGKFLLSLCCKNTKKHIYYVGKRTKHI